MTARGPEPLQVLEGLVLPIDRANVDTDAILPKQYMKSIRRTGFGDFLFDDWRYLDPGEPGRSVEGRRLNPDSVLNQPRYAGASILLTRENFGCGSSREHAVWALRDYGIRVIVAPSFADIFRGNCLKNNVLPIQLGCLEVDELFREVVACPGLHLRVSLPDQAVQVPQGRVAHFELEPSAKRRLLEGLDDIALTLSLASCMDLYERAAAIREPWLFLDNPAIG